MKYLYRSIRPLTIDGFAAILRVKTDGESLFVTLTPAAQDGSLPDFPLNLTLSYAGASLPMISSPFRETEAVFPYDENGKRLTLSGMTVLYGGAEQYDFVWNGSAAEPDPVAEGWLNGIRRADNVVVYWTYAAGEGRTALPVLAELCWKTADGAEAYRPLITGAHTEHPDSFSFRFPSDIPDGTGVRMRFCFASFDPASGTPGENYVGLTEMCSTVHLPSAGRGRFTPTELTCRRPVSGAPVTIRWNPVNDDHTSGYELQRSVNGGEFAMIYRGTSVSFTDTAAPSWDTVTYRVKTTGIGTGATYPDSGWNTGETWEILRTNLYLSRGGRLVPAAALILGNGNGEPIPLIPVLTVG